MDNPNDVLTVIDERVRNITSGIMTTLPGVIVSYNPPFARVKASVDFNLPDGRSLPFPEIDTVVINFLSSSGGNAYCSVPIHSGDKVILHFASQALDGYLMNREDIDPRKHDLSDCFATPGIYPEGISEYNATDVVLYNAGSLLRIEPGGDIHCNTNLIVDGEIRSSGDQIAGTISQQNHVHGGVQSGGSNTGIPVGGE